MKDSGLESVDARMARETTREQFLAQLRSPGHAAMPLTDPGTDLVLALDLCELCIGPEEPLGSRRVGVHWLRRAMLHLGNELDRYLRAGALPPADSDEERGAGHLLLQANRALTEAAASLTRAAHALRDAGKAHEASVAHDAYRAAQAAAEATALEPYRLPLVTNEP